MLIWVHTVTINHNGLRNNSTPFGTQAKAQDFVDACERADSDPALFLSLVQATLRCVMIVPVQRATLRCVSLPLQSACQLSTRAEKIVGPSARVRGGRCR